MTWSVQLIYALALVALMYGFCLLPELSGCGSHPGGRRADWRLFVAWELRTPHPVLNVRACSQATGPLPSRTWPP